MSRLFQSLLLHFYVYIYHQTAIAINHRRKVNILRCHIHRKMDFFLFPFITSILKNEEMRRGGRRGRWRRRKKRKRRRRKRRVKKSQIKILYCCAIRISKPLRNPSSNTNNMNFTMQHNHDRDRHYQRTLHLSSLCALYPGHWSYCSYCSIASRSERRFPWRSLYFQALPRHLALLVVNSALLASPLPLRHKPLLNCAITCEWLRSYHFGSWSFQLDPSSARYRLLQTHSRVRSR